MAEYSYFTEDQIRKANAASLEFYLRSKGESLIRSGREWRWKAGHRGTGTINILRLYKQELSGRGYRHGGVRTCQR